jgi:hypothetical protein
MPKKGYYNSPSFWCTTAFFGCSYVVAYGFIRTRRDGFIRRNSQLDISTDKSVSTGSDKSVSYDFQQLKRRVETRLLEYKQGN